ncbi:MAG: helix-turn-helix domain-containing protein [Bacteroides sp.]|nr:helix-turn-helix domain-containing protein [Bacteroides sp.]
MEIKDRINLVMENENMKSGTFAESLGMIQSTLSHILTGRNKPSLEVIMKIHKKYPYINLEWLLYGTGEMMAEEKSPSSSISQGNLPSLFDQNPVNPSSFTAELKNRKEIALETTEKAPKETVIQEIKYIEKPHRKITEIRIFFDDNTYEIFRPEK